MIQQRTNLAPFAALGKDFSCDVSREYFTKHFCPKRQMKQGLCVIGSKDAAMCLSDLTALPRYNSACDESIPPETNQFFRSTNQFVGFAQQSFGCESICRICATILTKGCQKPTGDTHQRINATTKQFCRLHAMTLVQNSQGKYFGFKNHVSMSHGSFESL